MINEKRLKDSLMCGGNYYLEKYDITIINYSLKQIFCNIGEDILNHYLKICIIDTSDLKDIQKLKGRNDLDFFVQYEEMQEIIVGFLNLFTSSEWTFIPMIRQFVTNDENRKTLTKEFFDDLREVCSEMYCLKKPKEDVKTKAKTKYGEDLLKEFMEEEKKINRFKEASVTLQSIVFSICSRNGSNYNMFNIMDLKMYQLIKIYYHMIQSDSYFYTLASVYNGKMEAKTLEKMNWANDIDLNKV